MRGCRAVTPAYASLDALWTAWLTGATGVKETLADWQDLTSRVVHGLAPADGFVLATTKGDMALEEQWIRGERLSPPPVLSSAARRVADAAGLCGPSYCVSTACSSGLAAIIEAAILVKSAQMRCVTVCGADIASRFVQDGFAALKAISPTVCRPFDLRRDGLTLGSAAAACTVDAESTGIMLSGYAMANDAVHMTAPDRQGRGLMRAITGALEMANLGPSDIDVILPHGTGTRYNDAMEAIAMGTLFPHAPAITAIKGLIGHTLGAAGLIDTCVGVRMLEEQMVPPVIGLEQSEFGQLNLVTGLPRKMHIRHVLKTASGFGGVNAAIVLSRS